MRLLLMRHGIAEEAGAATGYRDEPRALTADGEARMEQAARGLVRLELGVEAVLTSPLTRCRQTATIVAAALGVPVHPDRRLAPGAELGELADVLLGHPDLERVVVCGHQPDLSALVAALTGGLVEFRRGTLAVIEADAPRERAGYLRALLPPAVLRALAD